MNTEVLKIIIWPVIVLLVVVIFRKQIAQFIEKVTHFSISKDGIIASVFPQTNESRTRTIQHNPIPIDQAYLSLGEEGEVFFDYSNNNGIFTVKNGENRFDTRWSKASRQYIHFYSDHPNIKTVRLVKDTDQFDRLDPQQYDSSSRVRTAGINQIAIFENTQGKFLAVKILGLKDDSRGDSHDEIHFKYKII